MAKPTIWSLPRYRHFQQHTCVDPWVHDIVYFNQNNKMEELLFVATWYEMLRVPCLTFVVSKETTI
jgi:hypothetical protein